MSLKTFRSCKRPIWVLYCDGFTAQMSALALNMRTWQSLETDRRLASCETDGFLLYCCGLPTTGPLIHIYTHIYMKAGESS